MNPLLRVTNKGLATQKSKGDNPQPIKGQKWIFQTGTCDARGLMPIKLVDKVGWFTNQI